MTSPANLFVATFVGSPQINLIRGKVQAVKKELYSQCPAFSVNVSDLTKLQEYRGKEVTLGLRPESLSPREGPIRKTIELVEHLGSETILHARAGHMALAARVSSDTGIERGETVSFGLAGHSMHFFPQEKRIAGRAA